MLARLTSVRRGCCIYSNTYMDGYSTVHDDEKRTSVNPSLDVVILSVLYWYHSCARLHVRTSSVCLYRQYIYTVLPQHCYSVRAALRHPARTLQQAEYLIMGLQQVAAQLMWRLGSAEMAQKTGQC